LTTSEKIQKTLNQKKNPNTITFFSIFWQQPPPPSSSNFSLLLAGQELGFSQPPRIPFFLCSSPIAGHFPSLCQRQTEPTPILAPAIFPLVAPPNGLHSGSLLPQLRPTHGCANRPAVAPCAQETLPSPPLSGSSSPSTTAGHTWRNPHL
jgi:hypothetical protein